MTRSTNGFTLRDSLGVPKQPTNNSFNSKKWGLVSNSASNDKMGRDPFNPFPVSLSSDNVWTS